MSRNIFRAEVRAHADNAWLGRILLIRPVSFSFLTVTALVFTAALITFFLFGEYTRKARITGVLAPIAGVVRIVAQQSGTIESVQASEGDTVSQGSELLVINDGRGSGGRQDIGAAVAATLTTRQRALEHQREFIEASMRTEQLALGEREAGMLRELDQIDNEILSQTRRLAISEQHVGRARNLEGVGFLSPAAVDREREASMEQQGRLEGLRRTRLAIAREMASVELEAQAARARAQAQIAALESQQAAVAQERVERGMQYRASVSSPADGKIATILVQSGQMVAPGTPLATIIPEDAELEAHLFAPSRSIGFLREGQDVLLRYLAFPHQKFGMHRASVVAVAKNPVPPADLGFTPLDGSREPVYRIRAAIEGQAVRAYGRLEPLQAGMQVEADVLLDRRRLIEWIFEPLLSLAGRA
jgi:membrane fusion protein